MNRESIPWPHQDVLRSTRPAIEQTHGTPPHERPWNLSSPNAATTQVFYQPTCAPLLYNNPSFLSSKAGLSRFAAILFSRASAGYYFTCDFFFHGYVVDRGCAAANRCRQPRHRRGERPTQVSLVRAGNQVMAQVSTQLHRQAHLGVDVVSEG